VGTPSINPQLAAALWKFRTSENDDGRGPLFAAAARELETQINTIGVSRAMLLSCFGPPDLWTEDPEHEFFCYRFDQEEAGLSRDEWYFHLRNKVVINSGFTPAGVNDLSSLSTLAEFPSANL
jgi:hypothetical protein